mmetsp:Transcript_128562/g.357908  ORF Transcript_128562/g.357908 Transcript_128562/m.357908 type:complete len:213 (+) Transcript_128562:184-822(+)
MLSAVPALWAEADPTEATVPQPASGAATAAQTARIDKRLLPNVQPVLASIPEVPAPPEPPEAEIDRVCTSRPCTAEPALALMSAASAGRPPRDTCDPPDASTETEEAACPEATLTGEPALALTDKRPVTFAEETLTGLPLLASTRTSLPWRRPTMTEAPPLANRGPANTSTCNGESPLALASCNGAVPMISARAPEAHVPSFICKTRVSPET